MMSLFTWLGSALLIAILCFLVVFIFHKRKMTFNSLLSFFVVTIIVIVILIVR